MYWLTRGVPLAGAAARGRRMGGRRNVVGPVMAGAHVSLAVRDARSASSGLPLWIVLVVLGREALMTVFRQYAARRGVDHLGHRSGEVEDRLPVDLGRRGVLLVLRRRRRRGASAGRRTRGGTSRMFNGIVGIVAMVGAVALTLYSLWLYVRRYGVSARRLDRGATLGS